MSAKWKKRYPEEVAQVAGHLEASLKEYITLSGLSIARIERMLSWTRGFLNQKLGKDYRLSLEDFIAVLYALADHLGRELDDIVEDFMQFHLSRK